MRAKRVAKEAVKGRAGETCEDELARVFAARGLLGENTKDEVRIRAPPLPVPRSQYVQNPKPKTRRHPQLDYVRIYD